MVSAAELRAELKAIRKEHPDHRPVSKMKKSDISELIQRMKAGREETPNVAATAALAPKTSSVETISHAKADEFPTQVEAPKKIKKVVKKVKVAEKEHHKKEMPKKEMPKKEHHKKEMHHKKEGKKEGKKEMAPPAKKGRHPKGSAEAKAHMAAIRAKKGKSAKKDE